MALHHLPNTSEHAYEYQELTNMNEKNKQVFEYLYYDLSMSILNQINTYFNLILLVYSILYLLIS